MCGCVRLRQQASLFQFTRYTVSLNDCQLSLYYRIHLTTVSVWRASRPCLLTLVVFHTLYNFVHLYQSGGGGLWCVLIEMTLYDTPVAECALFGFNFVCTHTLYSVTGHTGSGILFSLKSTFPSEANRLPRAHIPLACTFDIQLEINTHKHRDAHRGMRVFAFSPATFDSLATGCPLYCLGGMSHTVMYVCLCSSPCKCLRAPLAIIIIGRQLCASHSLR